MERGEIPGFRLVYKNRNTLPEPTLMVRAEEDIRDFTFGFEQVGRHHPWDEATNRYRRDFEHFYSERSTS